MYTDEEREKAWGRITLTVEKYSDELVEQWNKEIDGLLTFVCSFIDDVSSHADGMFRYRLVCSLPFCPPLWSRHISFSNRLLRIRRMRSSPKSPTSSLASAHLRRS